MLSTKYSENELPEGFKDIRCIICPTGCLVHVENVNGELIIEGHSCKRGEEYARDEFVAPKRILTTTMRVENGILPLKKELAKYQAKNRISQIPQKRIVLSDLMKFHMFSEKRHLVFCL